MGTKIQQSNATITYIKGDHIQDLQILIDDYEIFSILPGKHERQGIKTITNWPIFVTVIWRENYIDIGHADPSSDHGIREVSADYQQIPLFDQTSNSSPTAIRFHRRNVDRTLAEIRKLHEQLNAQLYTHPTERPVIHHPGDAFEILHCFIGPLDHEELWVLNLDTRNRVMSMTTLYKGSVNSSQVRIGEVFRQAIIENAPAIIIAHNHPSSDPTPSPDDVAVTRGIVEAGKLLDISVLDHIIVTRDRFVSLKEGGLGFS